ncbi:MAG: addiction module protein [Gemmatimonadetes bacterium]|nr:addiction module protein [Gemmatimonadota bacterium]
MAKHVREPDYSKLSIAQRIALVEDIWDSIAKDARALPLTDDLRAELDRRWAEHERDPSSAIPWEQIKKELLEHDE